MITGIFSNEILIVRWLQLFIRHTVESSNNPLLPVLITTSVNTILEAFEIETQEQNKSDIYLSTYVASNTTFYRVPWSTEVFQRKLYAFKNQVINMNQIIPFHFGQHFKFSQCGISLVEQSCLRFRFHEHWNLNCKKKRFYKC